MKAVKLKGVSYRYPQERHYAIKDLDLAVEEGDFVLLQGGSGSGKSTLCRILNGLIPNYFGGHLTGSVFVDGLDASKSSVSEMSKHVGLLFQDPENQLVMSYVANELAFGLENLNMPADRIRLAVEAVSRRFGIEDLVDRSISELSGGEKQKVILASILAMKPEVLLLDEPTSQLDSDSRRQLYRILDALNDEGTTIMVVEHNTEITPYVDWVFDVESKMTLEPALPRKRKEPVYSDPETDVVLEVSNLSGGYRNKTVLKGINLQVKKGECLAITGPNGSGKTTLVKHFNGLLKPFEGDVAVFGMDTKETKTEVLARKIAYLPQNPSDMLFSDTVLDEVLYASKHLGVEADANPYLERFDLLRYKESYPRDLSVGEKQRVALSSVLCHDPEILVLDEPTRGIDAKSSAALASTIKELLSEGKTVVFVTQDDDLVSKLATRKIRISGGAVEE